MITARHILEAVRRTGRERIGGPRRTPRKPVIPLHPALANFTAPGGLFDVPPGKTAQAMRLNIGKRCVFRRPSCWAERDTFTIQGIQKDYKDDIIYRVVGDLDLDQFGRGAAPAEIRIIDTVLRRVK